MPPPPSVLNRSLNPGRTNEEFAAQWSHPADVFSVLLILGGDVINRALAQLVGKRVCPVAFSFGTGPLQVSSGDKLEIS